MGVFGEFQRRQFFSGEPAYFGGIARGQQVPSNPAAQKINQHVVVLHAVFGIAQHAVVDPEQFSGLDDQSRFFARLADRGFAHQFSDFEHASWNGPLGLQRRVRTLHQQNTGILNDDGANADQRNFWKLSLHGSIRGIDSRRKHPGRNRNDVDYIGHASRAAKVEDVGHVHRRIAKMALERTTPWHLKNTNANGGLKRLPSLHRKWRRKAGNRFVVQKHDATRLHYDFRLEMEGVLKSWAVPKGPSLDPEDKRLAMHVEDHPVSYFDFEGNIPENNYGAGTVIVWDVGTWQPLSPVAVDGKYVPGTEAEAAAMLAKGDLKFRLNGKRLKGDFALIKMRGRRPGSKGNEWLMIKKHDDQVVEGYDIEEFDDSVLSSRNLAEMAGDAGSAEWKSRPSGPRKIEGCMAGGCGGQAG